MRSQVVFLVAAVLASAPAVRPEPAKGPLRVLESNPRYFTDGSGKAVYLAGSHTWANLVDNGLLIPGAGDPPPAFDYSAFLDLLESRRHNFFRLWRWEVPQWTERGQTKYCRPHPWPRSGPGRATDERPKFDLASFDPEYFERMRSRVIAARDRGMYVAVMLFEGWHAQFTDGWQHHPFHASNNVNGIDGDRIGYFTIQRTGMGRRILALQEAYVRKVVDTVNDLENVLYEVCNEAGPYSTEWQYYVIRYVKQYEAGKPKQHPVGMTFQYRGGENEVLFKSPADWISPNRGGPAESYVDDPSGAYRGKVIVNDTDHLWGHTGGDNVWVWKSFTRGLNVLFMEELTPSPAWQDSARDAMGQTRTFAERIDLATMVPNDKLCQTRYCLADPGKDYLVFQPGNQGEFWVNLKDVRGTLSVEWLDIHRGKTVSAEPVAGGEVRPFTTPFPGPAALYLKLQKE